MNDQEFKRKIIEKETQLVDLVNSLKDYDILLQTYLFLAIFVCGLHDHLLNVDMIIFVISKLIKPCIYICFTLWVYT